jgi:hypothetical protein
LSCGNVPDHDLVFLFDQSSGHGKQQKHGLNALSTNSDYGGAVPDMQETTVTNNVLLLLLLWSEQSQHIGSTKSWFRKDFLCQKSFVSQWADFADVAMM